MINDPKPYGVGAGRLWLESHMSKLDPKIGDPYATQVVKELDAYVERAILQARSQAYEGLRSALIAKKYLPSQGMDAEMEAFNDGLDEAIALVSEGMKDG